MNVLIGVLLSSALLLMCSVPPKIQYLCRTTGATLSECCQYTNPAPLQPSCCSEIAETDPSCTCCELVLDAGPRVPLQVHAVPAEAAVCSDNYPEHGHSLPPEVSSASLGQPCDRAPPNFLGKTHFGTERYLSFSSLLL